MNTDDVLREASASSCITFGTTAAYVAENPYVKRIGFANIPVVGVLIISNVDTRDMTPIARQIVFRKLRECNIPIGSLKLTPTVACSSRKRKFTDANTSSPTHGKKKVGREMDFHFEIEVDYLHYFQGENTYGRLAFPTVK